MTTAADLPAFFYSRSHKSFNEDDSNPVPLIQQLFGVVDRYFFISG